MRLNGLGVVKPGQEAGSTTALGRRPGKAVENEFNHIEGPTPLVQLNSFKIRN